MKEECPPSTSAWQLPVLVALIELVAIVIVVWLAAGGHGTNVPAKLLFPYTMSLMVVTDGISELGFLALIAQCVTDPFAAYRAAESNYQSPIVARVGATHATIGDW